MHTRRVEYRGFHREDGLWDIEGEMLDTKPHGMLIEGEREWAPNEPIHHMHIRVTLNDAFIVQAIEVAMDAFPHNPCPQAQAPMQRLVGESLGRGWRKTIERHLGGVEGCTHLRELLFNLATAAFQTRSASFATAARWPSAHAFGPVPRLGFQRAGGGEGLPDVFPLAATGQDLSGFQSASVA